MIELYLSKNNNHFSEAYGKYYPRVSYKETLDIHLMAKHMSEHNTPFSEGTIEGILRDFVKCTREQTLMGNTVKVDDLAMAPQRAAARRLVVTTRRAVAALTLAAIRAVARPFRAKETDLKVKK